MRSTVFLAAALLPLAPVPCEAAPQDVSRPKTRLLDDLAACRSIADAAARLACFDKASAGIAEAAARKELLVVNRDDLRQTRRSLFGFSLPKLPFFSGDDSDKDQAQEISSTVASANPDRYGKWIITLAEGGTWRQIDDRDIRVKRGDAVRIREAALGSYFANVGSQRAIRARRER